MRIHRVNGFSAYPQTEPQIAARWKEEEKIDARQRRAMVTLQ